MVLAEVLDSLGSLLVCPALDDGEQRLTASESTRLIT